MREIFKHYHKHLDEKQLDQLMSLEELYKDWNEKINVISRKDIERVLSYHVLHSLVIGKYINFVKGAKILDIGTGGGLPGVPLAIMFPHVEFHLVDSVGKKLKVINGICEALDIKNIKTFHQRAESIKDRYDFVVSRSVAQMNELLQWTYRAIKQDQMHGIPNGWIFLKGGDLREEINVVKKRYYIEIESIKNYYKNLSDFEDKYIVYVQN